MPTNPVDSRQLWSRMLSTRYCDGLIAFLLRQQVEGQGQDVDGLRVAFDAPIRGDVGVVEGLANVLEELLILLCVLLLAERLGDLGHQLRAAGEVGRGEHVFGRIRLDAQPVAVAFGRPQQGRPTMVAPDSVTCLCSTRSTSAWPRNARPGCGCRRRP